MMVFKMKEFTMQENLESIHNQEYKDLGDEYLHHLIKSIQDLNEICNVNLQNYQMHLKWSEHDLNSLYDRKLDELSDAQIAAEVRNLISRRNYYRKEMAEYELYILANDRLLKKIANELASREAATGNNK
jgi:hypothetical protein